MLTAIAYDGKGTFVAIGSNGKGTIRTTDGVTWDGPYGPDCNTNASKGSNIRLGWSGLAYGNGTFVAVATNSPYVNYAYGPTTMRSTDVGITWTCIKSADDSNSWSSVTYGSGMFVAVALGYKQKLTMRSTDDGLTWKGFYAADANSGNSGSTNTSRWWSVAYGNGMFAAVGERGDGVSWAGPRIMSHVDMFY